MKVTKLAHNWKPEKARVARFKKILESFPGGIPRSEYPRPQFVRNDWQCLNGQWEFSFDAYRQGLENRWQEKKLPDFILVPFAAQAELSGKDDQTINEVAWYARDFEVPDAWRAKDKDVLLHIGACDYKTSVWVNGKEVGHNQGGHVPFWFDITPYLDKGNNRINLCVEDRQDAYQPRGKQSIKGQPEGIDYHCTTGIWQSVWLESAPSMRIHELALTPQVGADPANDALEVTVHLHAPGVGWHVRVEVLESEDEDAPVVAFAEDDAAGAVARLRVALPHAKRWSPDAPHLYGVRVSLASNGKVVDEVRSYTGLRGVKLRDGKFFLNGESLYLKMILDQGYWPDGNMTAPSDDALRADVEWMKKFGFNGARKHQKVEDPRWLYWCDKLGLLVWGEMANARVWCAEGEEKFVAEWERAVRRDYNHPCVVAWVPLNESWGVPGLEQDHAGQYAFVERVVSLTRRIDPTRPVIDNDGWEHTDVTDIVAIHDYTTGDVLRKRYAETLLGNGLPRRSWGGKHGRALFAANAAYHGQPIMLTEVGGFLNIPNLPKEKWDDLYRYYNTSRTPEELLAKYKELMQVLSELSFVSGFCYTQLTDIEQEINGLLTYDRKPKVNPEHIAAIHRDCFEGRGV